MNMCIYIFYFLLLVSLQLAFNLYYTKFLSTFCINFFCYYQVITCAVRGKNLKSYDKSLKLGFDTLLKQLSLDFEKVNKKVLEDTEVHDAEMKEKIKLRNERVQQKIAER